MLRTPGNAHAKSSLLPKTGELFARLALASINDPAEMERYNALALKYLANSGRGENHGAHAAWCVVPDMDRD